MDKLPSKEATRIAREYMRQYEDMPIFAFPKPRQYLEMERSRVFEICYGCMLTHTEYVPMVIRVKDDESVTLTEDRRDVVRNQLARKGSSLPHGNEFAESVCGHFERAVHEQGAEYPEWIIGIRMDEGEAHDAIVTFRKSNGEQVDLPICVFRNSGHKAAFFTAFRGNPETRLAVTMKPTATPKQIRDFVIAQIGKRRKTLDARDSAA